MKLINEDYKQKPAEYLGQLVELSSKLSIELSRLQSSNQINLSKLTKEVAVINDLAIRANAIFKELYSASAPMFERVDGNYFKVAAK